MHNTNRTHTHIYTLCVRNANNSFANEYIWGGVQLNISTTQQYFGWLLSYYAFCTYAARWCEIFKRPLCRFSEFEKEYEQQTFAKSQTIANFKLLQFLMSQATFMHRAPPESMIYRRQFGFVQLSLVYENSLW